MMAERNPQQNDASLRLVAFAVEDVAVVSANLQDAIVRVADMAYLPKERRFALVCQRFDWVAAEQGRMERCQTGLHFDAVRSAAVQGFDLSRKDSVLNLLSVACEETDAPAAVVTLTFSGGGAIRLEVDYVEAQMSDLDLRWRTRRRPGHELGGEQDGEPG